MVYIVSFLGFRGGGRGLEVEYVEVLRRSGWVVVIRL